MTKWKTCTIADLGKVVGGATPSTKKAENYNDGTIAWLTPKDLAGYSGRYIWRGERNITEIGLNSCSAKMMPAQSILFSSRAPIGYVAIAGCEMCTNQGFKSVVPNNNTDYMFLYYLLKYNKDKIEAMGSGTTFKEVSGSTMKGIEVSVPELLDDQRKIAAVLSTIDEKIEENEAINENLEQQAQTLYSAWFENFIPFCGEIPSNWNAGFLGDIAKICTSSFNPTKNPGVKLEHYSIPAFDENKYPVFETSNDIKSNKYILSSSSVLASKLNPETKRIWRPLCITSYAVCSTEFIVFETMNPLMKDFVYSIIDSAEFYNWMCSHTTGSTNSRQRTTPTKTLEFKIIIPPENVIKDFCSIVTPMYDLIAANSMEIQRLSKLRDALLPKLMSGEINVSSVQF